MSLLVWRATQIKGQRGWRRQKDGNEREGGRKEVKGKELEVIKKEEAVGESERRREVRVEMVKYPSEEGVATGTGAAKNQH